MKYKNRHIQIACDGGAATGKSTGAKMISKKYKLKFLSSGLLYRYAAYLIIKFKPKNKISFLKLKFSVYRKKQRILDPLINKSYSTISVTFLHILFLAVFFWIISTFAILGIVILI